MWDGNPVPSDGTGTVIRDGTVMTWETRQETVLEA